VCRAHARARPAPAAVGRRACGRRAHGPTGRRWRRGSTSGRGRTRRHARVAHRRCPAARVRSVRQWSRCHCSGSRCPRREGRLTARRSSAKVSVRWHVVAVDGHFECPAYGAHPVAAQCAEPIHEDRDRHALDRVQVDRTSPGDGIVTGLQDDLARESADRRRARRDDRSAQSGNGYVPRQHHNGTAPDVGKLGPPQLATPGGRRHEAAAASRNDARSPHSSGSSMGCSSYAS
jgi:hypothetical protein